jgi:cobalamin biosynthetic protein CobC
VTDGEEGLALFTRHGGRLRDAQNVFPHAPTPWLDLSTGVNPHPWSGTRSGVDTLASLPDPSDIMRLEAVAARVFGVDPAHVIAVSGADSALRLLPYILRAQSVAIASPTYSGHAEAWTAAGTDIQCVVYENALTASAEAIVVVNPNNPDGKIAKPSDIAIIKNKWVIVDESFGDLTPGLSVAAHAHRNIIVLRSFGKFFGLPGVRLGFVVADPSIVAKLRKLVGDWPISADAVTMGTAAYADTNWQTQMRNRLATEAQQLDQLLIRHGFSIVGGTALFRLVARPDAHNIFRILAARGILVRAFDGHPTWLRFGLPGSSHWPRLTAALDYCS